MNQGLKPTLIVGMMTRAMSGDNIGRITQSVTRVWPVDFRKVAQLIQDFRVYVRQRHGEESWLAIKPNQRMTLATGFLQTTWDR